MNTKRIRDKLPKIITEEIAEIVGIHFGDGSMGIYNNTHVITYTFDLDHIQYADYVYFIFDEALNICHTYYFSKKGNF